MKLGDEGILMRTDSTLLFFFFFCFFLLIGIISAWQSENDIP